VSSPAEVEFNEDAPTEEVDDALLESETRFAGDTGTLPIPARRVLVRLLQGPSLDARRHEKLWGVLKRHEPALRSHLHNLFLDLILDNESRVAFVRQVVSDEVDVPILLRRQSLSFLESVLLLFLRQKLTFSDAQAERAVVDPLEMKEYLRAYEKSENVDASRFDRQMERCVEKAKNLGVLLRLPGSEDRFEISPILRLLFPVEEIQALIASYRRHTPAAALAQEGESA
jgi:hypothetical protein